MSVERQRDRDNDEIPRADLADSTELDALDPAAVQDERDALDPQPGGRIIEERTTAVNGQVRRSVVERARTFIRSEEQLDRLWLRGARRTVYFIVHVIVIFILIRFFLLLTGANPENAFASFIYGLTAIFMAPFTGLFGPNTTPTYGINVFEPSAFVAIGIYYLFAWIGVHLVGIGVRRRALRRVERPTIPPTHQ
jgi:uncharacterized protein YggT (Ycf19 family)